MANVDVETLLVKLEGRITDFEKKMAKAQSTASGAASKIEKSLGGVADRVNGALGLVGAGFSVALLVSKVKTAVSELGNLADAATQAGVSAEALQVFRFAISQAGGDAEDADKALAKFNTSMGDVAITGKGPAADALKSIGINIRDAGFESANTEQKFRLVVDRLSGIKDQAKLASVAGEIFGDKLGPKLLGVLAQGNEGLITTEESMRRLHQLISNEMVEAGDTLDDKFKSWAQTIDTIFKQAVVGAAGAVSQLSANMNQVASDAQNFVNDPSVKKFIQFMFGAQSTNNPLVRQFLSGIEGSPDALTRRNTDPAAARAAENQSMQDLAELDAKRRASVPEITVTPVDHAAEAKAARTAEQAQKKIDDVVKSLKLQTDQLGRTSREQAIYNALSQAGVDVNSIAGQEIAALAGHYEDLQAQQAAIDSLASSTFDFFESVIGGSEDAGQALEKFIQQLLIAEARSLFLNAFNPASPLGPIATLLGGLFGGARAGGGDVSAGKVYKVGERGAELFAPKMDGRIIPINQGGGSGSKHLIELMLTPEVDARIRRVSAPQSLGISVQVTRENNKQVQRQQERAG